MVLFQVSEIKTFSIIILSVISSVLPSVCCLVTKLLIGLLDLPSLYFIRLARVRSYSRRCILHICMASGPLPASLRALARLVQYYMLIASTWFIVILIPE